MAKKKSSYSEVNEMQDMSLEDLQSRFYSLAQRAEARNSARNETLGGGGAIQKPPQQPPSSFASLDLGGGVESASDFDTMNIDQLAEKYLDPATLETRPSYADGSAPERAIPKAVDGATWNRFKLSFGNKKPDEKVKYLEQDYGAGNVVYNPKRDQYSIKKDGAWFQLDPEGGGQGDFMERALERTRDVLADNADIAASVGLGIATAGAAAPLAAGLTGAAAIGGAAGVGAASGAGGAMGRVLMGRLVGTYEATPEEVLRDVAVETLISAAGGAFIPGAKWGTKTLGEKFAKAGPELSKADPTTKNFLAKTIGFLGNFGEENAERMVNRGPQVGKMMDSFKGSMEKALGDQVASTKALAQEVAAARLAHGNKIYGDFVKEVGEDFAPWVGKIFTKSNLNDDAISLIDQGVVKYANGKISLGVVDDATNVFSNPKALKVLEPVVAVMNRFNKMGIQTGEKGARAYLSFKELLNDAIGEAETNATKAGGDMALNAVKQFKKQVLEAYGNKAVNATKSPDIMKKLIAIDRDYAEISTLTEDFVNAAKKGGDFADDYYRKLYDNKFAPKQLNAKTVTANTSMRKTMDILGKYSEKLQMNFDDILDRKAAIAGSPLIRPGMASNVQTGAGMITGAFVNPATGFAVAAATSPRVNYNMARMASVALDGLNNFNKLSPEVRKQMLKSSDAIMQYVKPIVEIPGLEAQTAIQLQQMIQGGGNGQ